MRFLENRIPPPIVMVLFGVAAWALSTVTPRLDVSPDERLIAAALIAAVAFGFAASGVISFRRARTTVNPLKPETASTLVNQGVYRVSRNPMYVGMALLLLAWSAYLAAPLAALGAAGFVLFIQRFQIAPEERALRSLFGAEFDAYTKRVRPWL